MIIALTVISSIELPVGYRLIGEIGRWVNGVLIANATGKALAYALFGLQERGCQLIDHGAEVKHSKKPLLFVSFSPAVSKISQKAMRAETRNRRFYRKTDTSLKEIARRYNPTLQGWMSDYGRYHRSTLYSVYAHFNQTLVKWAMRKYKKLKGHKTMAGQFIEKVAK